MRLKPACVPLLLLVVLAGCNRNSHEDHIVACTEQSAWATQGKVPTGEIAISCPDHGIGPYGH